MVETTLSGFGATKCFVPCYKFTHRKGCYIHKLTTQTFFFCQRHDTSISECNPEHLHRIALQLTGTAEVALRSLESRPSPCLQYLQATTSNTIHANTTTWFTGRTPWITTASQSDFTCHPTPLFLTWSSSFRSFFLPLQSVLVAGLKTALRASPYECLSGANQSTTLMAMALHSIPLRHSALHAPPAAEFQQRAKGWRAAFGRTMRCYPLSENGDSWREADEQYEQHFRFN